MKGSIMTLRSSGKPDGSKPTRNGTFIRYSQIADANAD